MDIKFCMIVKCVFPKHKCKVSPGGPLVHQPRVETPPAHLQSGAAVWPQNTSS